LGPKERLTERFFKRGHTLAPLFLLEMRRGWIYLMLFSHF